MHQHSPVVSRVQTSLLHHINQIHHWHLRLDGGILAKHAQDAFWRHFARWEHTPQVAMCLVDHAFLHSARHEREALHVYQGVGRHGHHRGLVCVLDWMHVWRDLFGQRLESWLGHVYLHDHVHHVRAHQGS